MMSFMVSFTAQRQHATGPSLRATYDHDEALPHLSAASLSRPVVRLCGFLVCHLVTHYCVPLRQRLFLNGCVSAGSNLTRRYDNFERNLDLQTVRA